MSNFASYFALRAAKENGAKKDTSRIFPGDSTHIRTVTPIVGPVFDSEGSAKQYSAILILTAAGLC